MPAPRPARRATAAWGGVSELRALDGDAGPVRLELAGEVARADAAAHLEAADADACFGGDLVRDRADLEASESRKARADVGPAAAQGQAQMEPRASLSW